MHRYFWYFPELFAAFLGHYLFTIYADDVNIRKYSIPRPQYFEVYVSLFMRLHIIFFFFYTGNGAANI